jgi:putative transposase
MNALFREQLFIKIILELKLYSLKFGMKLKRSKIQSFALNHGRKGKELLRKYSYRGRNGMLHYVHKFVNKLLGMYSLTMFTVEKLNKKEMLQDASDRLFKRISRTVWRSIHRVLKCKASLYGSFIKEVNPYHTSKSCPRCG